MEDSTPSMTPRPVTDGSSVLVIVVPVSAAGTLVVITISAVLIVLLKRTCKLPSLPLRSEGTVVGSVCLPVTLNLTSRLFVSQRMRPT